MSVNIDPSEVRTEAARALPPRNGRRVPLKTVLLAGLGGIGLVAFTAGAFSFFSTLADPRPRKPLPMPVAASMPDIKDGLPALVDGAVQQTTTFNLPRSDGAGGAVPSANPAPGRPTTAEASAAMAAEPEPRSVPARTTVAEPNDAQMPALRTGPTPPPIQNAATVAASRTAAVVAPPARTVTPIAPARSETVKAKPVQTTAAAAHAKPSPRPAPTAEPTSTATVESPPPASPPHRTTASKPSAQRAAARRVPSAKTAAAEPEQPPVAAPVSTRSEETDIPGAKQFKAGVKAITGIFGDDSPDD